MIYLVNECHHVSGDAICPVDVLILAKVTTSGGLKSFRKALNFTRRSQL
jgi:hypothetical protein